jgi:hypothetical protein
MYFLIESMNNTRKLIGQFNSYLSAQNKAVELHNDFCDYFITKIVD